MKINCSRIIRFLQVAATSSLLAIGAGCENDDDHFDHDIPEGQGTIVVNNETSSDIYVYISGIEDRRTDAHDYEFYDRDPGTYRVVLEEKHGDRSWAGFVDVLRGKLTVLDIYTSSYYRDYDVYRRIE